MTNIGGGRRLRVCDLCGGVDDHPRHTLAGNTTGLYDRPADAVVERVAAESPDGDRARLIGDLFDTSSQERHKDCCRAAGCPTGDCDRELTGWDGTTGAGLLDHLMGA